MKEITLRDSVTDACLRSYKKVLAHVATTKAALLAQFRDLAAEHKHALRLAINEAEALAWKTHYPQLVFQDLAEEKAGVVVRGIARQNASPLRIAV